MVPIIVLHFKEFIKEKSNLIYLIFSIIAFGVIMPMVYGNQVGLIIAIVVSSGFASQYIPRVFVGEKENRTIETLLSYPISIKKIFIAKSIYGFLITTIFYYVLSLVTTITLTIVNSGVTSFRLELYNIFMLIFLIPINYWNFAYNSVYISFKSDDLRVCTMTLNFISMGYSIIQVIFYIFNNMYQNFRFVILIIYLLVEIAIFVIINLRVNKFTSNNFILSNIKSV